MTEQLHFNFTSSWNKQVVHKRVHGLWGADTLSRLRFQSLLCLLHGADLLSEEFSTLSLDSTMNLNFRSEDSPTWV